MKARNTLMMILSVFVLAGCAKNNSSSQAVRQAGVRGGVGDTQSTATQVNFIEKCSNNQSAYGYVYDESGIGTFEERVKQLLTATVDPSVFGSISGARNANTGVDMRLRLRVVNGQIVPTQSGVNLDIWDSNVGQTVNGQQTTAFRIAVGNATGTVSSNGSSGTFRLEFSDNNGKIFVNGQFDSSHARGTISFQNSTHFAQSTPLSGTLGSFERIPTCALFQQ